MKENDIKNPLKGLPEQIADEIADQIRQSVLDMIGTIRAGSSTGQKVITIDELERNWDILDAKTKKSYAKMIGSELSSIDEKELIESKKENSPRRG